MQTEYNNVNIYDIMQCVVLYCFTALSPNFMAQLNKSVPIICSILFILEILFVIQAVCVMFKVTIFIGETVFLIRANR